MIVIDFFEFDYIIYLIVVDYFFCYVEVVVMNKIIKLFEVIRVFKVIFVWYGILEEVRSDNGL